MSRIHFSLIISMLLVCGITRGYAQSSEMTSKWHTEKYLDVEKLSNLDFLYDREAELFYLITNDKQNLFIHLRATSESTQKKIINLGFTVIVSADSRSKKKLSIEYPLPKEERLEPIILLSNNSPSKRNDFNLTKSQRIKQIVQIRITDMADKKNPIIVAASNTTNINGSMTISAIGDLEYALVIPLSSLGIDLAASSAIRVKMKSGNPDADPGKSNNPSGPISGAGGMGGGMSQGMGGGGRPSGDRGGAPENGDLGLPIKLSIKKVLLLKELGLPNQ